MIQKAADEVFTEVEARLSAGYLPGTRRVAPDPIMTHRIQGGLEESVVPSARALGNLVGFSGIRVSLQSFWDTETTVDNARRPIRNLADVFKYFGEGYYPLPRMLQKLTLNLPSSTYMRDSVGFQHSFDAMTEGFAILYPDLARIDFDQYGRHYFEKIVAQDSHGHGTAKWCGVDVQHADWYR